MSILDGNKRSLLVHESPLLGDSLLNRGWRQGALFSATSACFTLKNSVDQNIIYLNPVVRVLSEEEISMAEYYATRPLAAILYYLAYYGSALIPRRFVALFLTFP